MKGLTCQLLLYHFQPLPCQVKVKNSFYLSFLKNLKNLILKSYYLLQAAVHWASKRGRNDILQWLHDNNADMNVKTVSSLF